MRTLTDATGAEDIRLLILRLAKENSWGSTRILGELKKLGVGKVSRTTVANLLREHGFDPGPQRGEGCWDAYVKRHAQTIWACDIVTKQAWTATGLKDHFILFFIHLSSRRVFVSGVTDHPTGEWVTQQARNFCLHAADEPRKPTLLLRDNDGKYAAGFDAVLKAERIRPQPLTPGSPNLNATPSGLCKCCGVSAWTTSWSSARSTCGTSSSSSWSITTRSARIRRWTTSC